MIKLALVLAAGYAGYKLAYHSEDGRHYGKIGDTTDPNHPLPAVRRPRGRRHLRRPALALGDC